MTDNSYKLVYWPFLQGRGEFVRLLLVEAGAAYTDVARLPEADGGGMPAVLRYIRGQAPGLPPLAPPILVDGELVLAQVVNICEHLAEKHGLVPADTAGRLAARQIALTVADLVAEAHDTHHPVAHQRKYETQKPQAKMRAAEFTGGRMMKFLGYLERVHRHHGGPWMLGAAFSYVDLSVFQVLSGLAYAYPKTFAAGRDQLPGLLAVQAAVAQRPRIAAYLASDDRLSFHESGIFRRYPELESDGVA